MSDNPNSPNDLLSQPSPAVPVARALRDQVEHVIASSGLVIRERVKNTLVEVELTKRADMVLKGLTKRDEAQKAINKIKPDQVAFNTDGSKASETFSKAKIDELNKAKQTLVNTDKALEEALSDTPNFEKLAKIVGGEKKSDSETESKSE